MDTNFDQDKLKQQDLADTVSTVWLVAYPNDSNEGDEDGNPPTNHWCTFLQIPDKRSVRLDMAPGYGSDGLRGKIEISSKQYIFTQRQIMKVSFPVSAGVTVQKVVDTITSKGHQKYQFTPAWEGCRYWNSVLISDLEEAGHVAQGSAKEALEALSFYWKFPAGSGKEPRAMDDGTFRA